MEVMKLCTHCNGTGVALDYVQIGTSLRDKRKAAGITLREMARSVGCSHSFLSQLENGKRAWRRSVSKRYELAIAATAPAKPANGSSRQAPCSKNHPF
jgi:transcriptional regulator with XRE-family HTH domain